MTEPTAEHSAHAQSLSDVIAQVDQQLALRATQGYADLTLPNNTQGSGPRFIEWELEQVPCVIAMSQVLRVELLGTVTHLPNVPRWLWGIANVQGEFTSVIDLRDLILGQPTRLSSSSRLLVALWPDEDLAAGLVVDKVLGIRTLAEERLGELRAAEDKRWESYIQGLCDDQGRILAVFDAEKLFSTPQMRQFGVN